MSLNNSWAMIPENSLLMFVCSVLQFEQEFIKAVKHSGIGNGTNFKESKKEMKKISKEFYKLRLNWLVKNMKNWTEAPVPKSLKEEVKEVTTNKDFKDLEDSDSGKPWYEMRLEKGDGYIDKQWKKHIR